MLDLATQLAQFTAWEYAEPASGTAIEVTKSGQISFATGASGETNTLAVPLRAGIELLFNCRSHGGGDRVITVASAINASGNTIMTFNTTRDNILLRSIKTAADTYAWQVMVNNGVSLS
jgi:predicted small integral membrane protein